MTRKSRNAITLTVFLIVMIIIAHLASGCSTLRLAPTEPQKQIALDTYQTAQSVNVTGAEPGTPATQKLVSGSATALTYMGMPAEPVITDYPATLETASTDAAKRPTIDDVADSFDGWMELGIGIAGLFGGSVGLKAAAALAAMQKKARALKEVVQGNEEFKRWLEANGGVGTVEAFRAAQTGVQTKETEQAVFAVRSELPPTLNLKSKPGINQA